MKITVHTKTARCESAFLSKHSVLDRDNPLTDVLAQRRTARNWSNPITRHKREKGVQDWAKSFQGKQHYRKLARFNATRRA